MHRLRQPWFSVLQFAWAYCVAVKAVASVIIGRLHAEPNGKRMARRAGDRVPPLQFGARLRRREQVLIRYPAFYPVGCTHMAPATTRRRRGCRIDRLQRRTLGIRPEPLL